MTDKTTTITANLRHEEGDSLKKLHRQTTEYLRVKQATEFNPAEGSGKPPNPLAQGASRIPAIDNQLAVQEDALAHARGLHHPNAEDIARLEATVKSLQDKYTFEVKREETRRRTIKEQEDTISKYMAICHAMSNIQGLPESKLRAITMNRELGLGDADMSIKDFMGSIKALGDGEARINFVQATAMIATLSSTSPDTVLFKDSPPRFTALFVAISKMQETLRARLLNCARSRRTNPDDLPARLCAPCCARGGPWTRSKCFAIAR